MFFHCLVGNVKVKMERLTIKLTTK